MSGHNHDNHHGHAHHIPSTLRLLVFAIILTFGFAIIEAVTGIWAHSLTLLSDAGHMGLDAVALILAAFASWLSKHPPSARHTFGLARIEVLAAWISSLLMLMTSIVIIIEAIERLHQPQPVHGLSVLIVAGCGFAINLLVAWLLASGERTINIRAAMLHVLSDLLGSMAAIISGAIIYFSHWYLIDPILSIFISILILVSSLRLLNESLRILMEAVPRHINIKEVLEKLHAVEGVENVHDLHIWTLSSGSPMLSAHVTIRSIENWPQILGAYHKLLYENYHIDHITLQPETNILGCKSCELP